MTVPQEHRLLMQALVELIDQRFEEQDRSYSRHLQEVRNGQAERSYIIGGDRFEVPPPVVHAHVEVQPAPVEVQPAPAVVNVDLGVLVSAVERLTAAVEALIAAHGHSAEMLSQLVQVQAGREQPVFKPTFQVPAPAPPTVVVEPAAAMPRPKRSLTIRHADGTQSVVSED